jgi:hypothetical protein
LDWEKEAKRLKVIREGAGFAYDELPAVGSLADKTRYLDQKGFRQAAPVKSKPKRFRRTRSSSTNKETAGAARQALEAIQHELVAIFDRENSGLMANKVWQRLSLKQRQYLRQRFGLHKPASLKIDTEEQINSTLRESSLAKRRNMVATSPRQFQLAFHEATRLLVLDGRMSATRK